MIPLRTQIPVMNRSRISAILFPLTLSAIALVVSFFPIQESDDDWWHLKAGKMLWEGQIGWHSPDVFTYTARDKVWVNHEWLAQLIFYGFVHYAGIWAANLFKSGLILLTFLVVYRSGKLLSERACPGSGVLTGAFAAALLAIPTSQFTMYLRPPVWTFLLLAVYHAAYLGAAHEPGARDRIKWILPAIMVVWANLHGGAILGCVVAVLMAMGAFAEPFLRNRLASVRTDIPWKSAALVALCVFAASILNPYGYHLHALTFEVMSLKWVTSRIHELAPPAFDLIWTVPLLLVPGVIGVVRFGTWGERLVFVFLAWQGISHVRHLPLLAIWCAPYAAAALSTLLATIDLKKVWVAPGIAAGIMVYGLVGGPWPPGLGILTIRLAVVGALLAVTAAAFVIRKEAWASAYLVAIGLAVGFVVTLPGDRPTKFVQAVSGTSWSGESLPDQIGEFVAAHNLEAPFLFTRENGAGVLIWNLSPERMPVFTCSRFDLQGVVPIMELESMLWMAEAPWEDKESGLIVPGWKTLWEEKYRTDLVVLENYSDVDQGRIFPLWTYLSGPDSSFVRVASEEWPDPRVPDRQYTLFVRKGDQLSRLMQDIGRPVQFSEPRSEP